MPAPEGRGPAAIVLAAGSSTRMGRNKLLLEIDGEAMVRRAVRIALDADLRPVIVVLGHESERVLARLSGLPCVTVVNPDHASGMRTSLQVGVARASVEADAAIVILADMPLVTAPMLRAMAARHGKTGAPLVVSRYGAVDAPPTLYHRSLFPEILALDGAHCGKRVAARHEREADVLTWPEEALYDVDVSEDYEGLPVSSRG